MKNLVIGSAGGFDWVTLEPFVTSFAKHVKNADLVLFLNDISDFTLEHLKNCGKESLKIEPLFYTNLNFLGIERYENFKRYIDAHGDEYAQIFITDTRDVIFQGDIFDDFKGYSNFLCYATEADDLRGTKSGLRLNYDWICGYFGKEETDKLLDKKIVCAGSALIGTPREMKIFLEKLFSGKIPEKKAAFDQVAFNYLIHNNLIPIENLIESDVHSGTIYTNGLINDNKIRGDKILRGDGGIPSVVHQYDRHDNLIELVDEIYRDKNFQFDARFTDPRSTLEQVASLLYANKVDEASRLFMKQFFSPMNFKSYNNLLIKMLTFALRNKFTPQLGLLELAIQNVLFSNKDLNSGNLIELYKFFIDAAKKEHSVDPRFKIAFTNTLVFRAKVYFKENNDQSPSFINLIEQLNMPLGEEFYLFAAKVYRTFGRKEEALEAYKKVLELS